MKKHILMALMALVALTASAVPAKKGQFKTLQLADGTTVKAMLVGDEHAHYYLGPNGQAYTKDATTGFYAATDKQQIQQRAKARRQVADKRRAQRLTKKAAPQQVGTIGDYKGSKKGLIILVNFSDVKFQSSNNQALYKRIANEVGFSSGSFTGSVHDYFTSQSDGQFDLTFDVVGPVTVSKAASYYGNNDYNDEDEHPAEMVIEALKLANSQVNYADYDWDGDGEVDQVMVIYAGAGEANGGAESTIWPHEYSLYWANRSGDGAGVQTMDGVKIDTYAVSCELQPNEYDYDTGEVTSWKIDGLGTICHEFSHCLGYPDFYDTDYSGGYGMDCFDLMCSGSYNNDGFTPCGYTSYERWVAGWKTPIELSSATTVAQMKALNDGGNSYVIYNDGHKDEYFLLENRQQTGWDKYLPGEGMLILHVDYDATVWEQNAPNDDPNHQRMTWVAADNELQYDQDIYDYYLWAQGEEVFVLTDEGLATDFFPSGSVNAFGNSTTPAAKLYNANTDGKKYLNKQVYDIARNGDGTLSFKFGEDTSEGAAGAYEKVTSASELQAGDQIIIVNEADGVGLSTNQKTNNREAVTLEVDGSVADPGSNIEIITLEGSTGAWYLKVEGGYLGNVDGNKNYLRTLTSKTNNAKATITISGGNAEIKFASGARNILRYNNSSASNLLFSCYASGQNDIQVYKKTVTTGINSITTTEKAHDGVRYNLSGQRVDDSYRGIVILNGRKVLVK